MEINNLIREENERKTIIGQEINSLISGNKIIPAEMIVRMLRKIIYSGDTSKKHFILTSFPDIIEQAKEFETNCSKIKAIIYCTSKNPTVEIKNNNLSLFNIDSYFQKDFRLRTMNSWDYDAFQEKLGNRTEFGIVVGNQFTGKTTICNLMNKMFNYQIINMKQIQEQIKQRLGTEEEPFEGEVNIADVEADIRALIKRQTQASEHRV